MGYSNLEPLFPLGEVLTSPGVKEFGIDIYRLLRRHQSGDWGEVLCSEDIEANDLALANGEAILSQCLVASPLGKSHIVTIMTEDNRLQTVAYVEGEPALLPAG